MSGYHKIRNGGEYLLKSVAALKNYIQQTDRTSEMPMMVKGSAENILRLQTHNMIEDALDLIEDGGIDDGDESDESQIQQRSSRNKPQQQREYVEDNTIQRPLWNWEAISDWGQRIAKYDAEQKKFYNFMVPKIQEIKGLIMNSTGWDLLVDSKQDQLKIEVKRSIRGNQMMRAEGPVDFPVKDIFRAVHYTPMR